MQICFVPRHQIVFPYFGYNYKLKRIEDTLGHWLRVACGTLRTTAGPAEAGEGLWEEGTSPARRNIVSSTRHWDVPSMG